MRLRRGLIIGTVAAVAVLGLSGTAQARDGGSHGNGRAAVVKVTDDCDPATFVANDVPCVGNGDTTFDEFIAELTKTGEADDWAFHPRWVDLDRGEAVKAVNVGGEFHTFTRVQHFGGGCLPVPVLNAGQAPVAECAAFDELSQTTGLPPGASLRVTSTSPGPAGFSQALQPGKNRFECLIHPWMRAVVIVEDDHGDHGHHGHH